MPKLNPLKMIGNGFMVPAQKAVAAVIPAFLEENLEDPEVRELVVIAADEYLTRTHPETKIIPKKTRRRLLRRVLDLALDEILLPA
jgi:hypothetical protein